MSREVEQGVQQLNELQKAQLAVRLRSELLRQQVSGRTSQQIEAMKRQKFRLEAKDLGRKRLLKNVALEGAVLGGTSMEMGSVLRVLQVILGAF